MMIYNTHPVSGAFIGSEEAQRDPLEPKKFLIPAHATKKTPPPPVEGQARVFRDNAWGYAPITDVNAQSSPNPLPPNGDDVARERQARLERGFDYDFNDYRGVHHFSMTPQDMVGWNRVTVLKDALFQAGDVETEIDLITDTGPVAVTGPEWNTLLLWAAINHEQPLWQSSFALQAMDPIPEDFRTNPAYWPQQN